MKTLKILIFTTLLFITVQTKAQTPINTAVKLDLMALDTKGDSLEFLIQLFDSYLGTGYQKAHSFILTKNRSFFDICLKEISFGIIVVKQGGEELTSSGTVVFNGDSLWGNLGKYNELVIRGGENSFMQENFMLPFNLPSLIANHKSFEKRMVQRSYELKIPEDPMLEAIYGEYLRNVLATVRQHQNSYHILRKLYNNASNITLQTLDTSLTIFNPKLLNTVMGRNLKTYIANGKWLIEKPNLEGVILMDTKEKKYSLSELFDSSKYIFIDFWASWCVPCRKFNKSLKQQYGNIDTHKLKIISISIDENIEKWKSALLQDGIPWENFIDPSMKGFDGTMAGLFNIGFIPQSFLFDAKGTLIRMNLTVEELFALSQ